MLKQNELLDLIKEYVKAYAADINHGVSFELNKKRTDLSYELFNEIQALYEVQAKLIERLNAYHSDTLALMESPEAAFWWDHQLTLDMNNEVYEFLGIEPPIQDM